MITDKLRSYAAARAKKGLSVEHRQHKGLNNRVETLISRPGDAKVYEQRRSVASAEWRVLACRVTRCRS
jgi:transposase-like protein